MSILYIYITFSGCICSENVLWKIEKNAKWTTFCPNTPKCVGLDRQIAVLSQPVESDFSRYFRSPLPTVSLRTRISAFEPNIWEYSYTKLGHLFQRTFSEHIWTPQMMSIYRMDKNDLAVIVSYLIFAAPPYLWRYSTFTANRHQFRTGLFLARRTGMCEKNL